MLSENHWSKCLCYVLSHFSHVQLVVTPWTVTRQAPLSVELYRQEYWRGLLFPSPGDLPDPGIKPGSPALQAEVLPFELLGKNFLLVFLKFITFRPFLFLEPSQAYP